MVHCTLNLWEIFIFILKKCNFDLFNKLSRSINIKHAQLNTTINMILLYYHYNSFLPESARWLISKHKHKKATSIIKSMAKVNGREVPSEVYEDVSIWS